jgi:hypothetical protein
LPAFAAVITAGAASHAPAAADVRTNSRRVIVMTASRSLSEQD